MTFQERYDQAKARLTQYLLAETMVLKGQSYSIGNRTLERADLRYIQGQIKTLTMDCVKMTRGKGIRVQRFVYRDL